MAGLRLHIHKGKDGTIPEKIKNRKRNAKCKNLPHVVLSLLGNFKGDGGVSLHLINLASTGMSGLELRNLSRLPRLRESDRTRLRAFAFATPEGDLEL